MRFYVSPCRKMCGWYHHLEIGNYHLDWIDCTDMSDREFELWMQKDEK